MLMGRTHAMMKQAGVNLEMQHIMWCEVANTATLLDNITVHVDNSTCAYKKFYHKTQRL